MLVFLFIFTSSSCSLAFLITTYFRVGFYLFVSLAARVVFLITAYFTVNFVFIFKSSCWNSFFYNCLFSCLKHIVYWEIHELLLCRVLSPKIFITCFCQTGEITQVNIYIHQCCANKRINNTFWSYKVSSR